MPERLPVHGFVLAGGKSSRMGMDKALLRVGGRPMIEIAVEKLREFCAEVSIAGNRDDLRGYAPVVHETRLEAGPSAGVETGLRSAKQEWVMFVPVDVPLVPVDLLRRFATVVLDREKGGGLVSSNLSFWGKQPAFCMMRASHVERFSQAMAGGERSLSKLFQLAAGEDERHWLVHPIDLYGDECPPESVTERWFANVNTVEDLAYAERWAASYEETR